MTAKDALRERVDEMTEDEAADLLDFVALQDDPDELSDDDVAAVLEARAAVVRGEYFTAEEIKAKYGL